MGRQPATTLSDGHYDDYLSGRTYYGKDFYQSALRAIGAYLDRDAAKRVTLVELPDGFTLRYAHDANEDNCIVEHLTFDGQPSSLPLKVRKSHRRRSHDTVSQHSYENVFRALGYELDRLPAFTVTLDEVDTGLLVTFQFLSESRGYLPHKRMVVLRDHDVVTLIENARGRRRKRKTLLTLLAG